MSTVLVTGGSGFVGSHVVLQLLNTGHDVRTTVRSLKKEESMRAMLRSAGADDGRLTVFSADLRSESGWPEATAGCDHVIHVASPLSDSAQQTEAAVIAFARDGTLRVLRAARDARCRCWRLGTSSSAARRRGEEGADAGAAELDRPRRGDLRSRHASVAADARQGAQRDEREGAAPSRLEAAATRGRGRRDGGEPYQIRNRLDALQPSRGLPTVGVRWQA